MNEKEYLEERVDKEISWYDRKSQLNQKWFKRLSILQFGAAALIPFLTPYISTSTPKLKITVGLFGVLIAVLTSIIGLYKMQEHWIQYRTASESLNHERFLFLTKVNPYDNDGAFDLFVQRIESQISKEHSSWATMQESKKKTKT